MTFTGYTYVNVTATGLNATVLSNLLHVGTASAASTGDVDGLLSLVQSLSGALLDPEAYGNLTVDDVVALRAELGAAINSTLSLTATLDSGTAAELVNALSSIAGSAADIDPQLFGLLLHLVQELAAKAGGAAGAFLGIVDAMLQSQGVGDNTVADAISSSLTSLSLSILANSVCGETPSNVSSANLVLLSSFQSTYANTTTLFGSGAAAVQYGSQFGVFTAGSAVVDDSACKKAQLVWQQAPPFVPPKNATFTSHFWWAHRIPGNASYVAVSFFNSNGTAFAVAGLAGEQVTKFSFAVPNCTAATAYLVYWNETLGDWDNQGVYRDNATILASGDNCTFVGYSTHFTVFTIGVISFELNVVDPAAGTGLLSNFANSRGAIMTTAVLAVLLFVYGCGLIYTVKRDRRDRREERIPNPVHLVAFCQSYIRLFGRRVPRRILETRCLDQWTAAYEIPQHAEAMHLLGFWERFRIHSKVGFRTSERRDRVKHEFISIFYKPLESYTRTQRLTVTFTILFVSMCTNALFYQFASDTSVLSVITLATRFLVGTLSSLIVFVPTTIISMLFRRVRPRDFLGLTHEQFDHGDLKYLELNEDYLQKRMWVQRRLLDWHVPWWVSPVLYAIIFAGWIVCVYFTLLYGVTFTFDQANAWLSSFAISVALSAIVLQSLAAVLGSILATALSTAAVASALGAMAIGAELAS